MHDQAYRYVKKTVERFELDGKDVVELGSYIVNGSVRPLFPNATSYVGVDVRPGRGVDIVSDARSYQPEAKVDVVVTTEMLEHCPQPERVIKNVAKMLKPGGMLVLTAAGAERRPHNNDGHAEIGREHYANIEEGDLYDWLSAAKFKVFEIERDTRAGDVYAWAAK